MIRVLIFLALCFSVVFALEVNEPLFPKGEKLEEITFNNAFGGSSVFLNDSNSFVTFENVLDSKIKFFDINNRKIFFQIRERKQINNFSVSKNSSYLIYDESSKLKVFDIKSKKVVQTYNLKNEIISLDISQDGKYMICSTKKNKIYLFDINKKKLSAIFSANVEIENIKISAKNNYIVSEQKGKIIIYDFKTFKKLYVFNIKKSGYWNKIQISNDEKYILSLSSEKILQVWDIRSQKLVFDLKSDNIKDVEFTNDSKHVVFGEKDILSILNIKTSANTVYLKYENFKNINDIAISHDDKKVLVNNQLLVNLETLKIINLDSSFRYGKNYYINEVIFIKKLSHVISKDYDKGIKFWNIKENKIDFILDKDKKINNMVVSRDEKYLLFSTGKNLKVWDLKAKEVIKKYQEENSTIKDVSFSNNGKLIAFKTDTKVKIFDFYSWKLLKEINCFSDLYELKFLEERYILLIEFDEIKVFEIQTGKLINHIKKEENKYSNVPTDSHYYTIKFYKKNKHEVRDILTNKVLFSDLSKDRYIADIRNNKVYMINYNTNKWYIWDLKDKKQIKNIKNKDNTPYAVDIDFESIGVFYLDENRTEKKIKEIFYNENYWAIADYETKKLYRYSDKNFVLNAKTYQPILSKELKVLSNDIEVFFDKKDIQLRNNENNEISIRVKNVSNHILYWIEPIIDNKSFTFESNNIIQLKPYEIKIIKLSLFYNKKLEHSIEEDFKLKIKIANSDFKEYLFHVKVNKEKKIKVKVINHNVKLINNNTSIFKIKLKNLTGEKLFDIKVVGNDTAFTMDTNTTIELEPYEEKVIDVLFRYNNSIEKNFQKQLYFTIWNNLTKLGKYNLNIEVENKAEIELVDIELGSRFIIKIKNLKNIMLHDIQISISDENETVKNISTRKISIESNSTEEIELNRDKKFAYKWDGYDVDINISANGLSKDYHFKQHIAYNATFLYIILGVVLLITPYYIYIGKFNFRVNKIVLEADKIFDVKLHKLPYYKKFLKRRMDKYYYELYFSYVLEDDLERVSKFYEVNNKEKAKIISEKVNGNLRQLDDNLFEIKLDKNFAIKVEKVLLYFSEDVIIEKIYKELEKEQNKPILLIAKNEKEQEILSENSKLNELKNVIATLPRNLKMFLLQENHSLTLSKILSTKLDRKLISPYNLKGGVQNESYFFGREKIINNIVNRELSNYLIVGARQIGKTSLLIALERIFKQRDELVTIFITISGDNIIKKIALKLKLSPKTTLEELEEYILTSNKKYLFLIDEVDGFVKSEEKTNYKILDTFRSLTQERQAYFIMAGFWELYAQATYDYQSPIKNFGEVITIDKLEAEACINLVFKPMEALNLRYENIEKGAVYMIQSLGQRANLIATVANQIVENLEPYRYEITREDIDRALDSRNVIDSFYSWKKLTSNKFKSSIDKFIVYYTIGIDSFTIRKIINFFKKLDVDKVTIEEIQESLDRLELSYILAKEGRTYFYTIPLFQEHLQRDDISVILDEMIDEFYKEYGE